MYEWYGDIEAVKKAYPMMKKYVDYLKSMSSGNILSHGLGGWYDLGPGFPGETQLTPKEVTATSIWYYDVKLLGKMAALTGEIGFRYLLGVLEEKGYSQLIYDMTCRSDVPGYGFQLSKGATYLTESWQV